jgi:gliding motility-associated-like protein
MAYSIMRYRNNHKEKRGFMFGNITGGKWRLLIAVILVLFRAYSAQAANYYWVGGSGNWNEINHWATTSGGSVSHAVTPSADDNVIFDANSFTAPGQIVTISDDIVFAYTINFTGVTNQPVFRTTLNVDIRVFGNFILAPSMSTEIKGNITLLGIAPDLVIQTHSKPLGGNIHFSGAGSWKITGDLLVKERITISSGNPDFGDINVQAKYLKADAQLAKYINFRNSKWRLTGGSVENDYIGSGTNYYTIEVNIDNTQTSAGSSVFELTDPSAKMFFRGAGIINLGSIFASSTMGTFEAKSLSGGVKLQLSGNLEIAHDGNLLVDFSCKDLILRAGYRYKAGNGTKNTVENILGSGTCNAMITLNSDKAGEACFISAINPVNLDFVVLRDVSVTGTFKANNSIDLGNNPGWILNLKPGSDLYWIGRNGNWSAPSSWSLSSGGAPSGCIPSLQDNVIFDQNSFTATAQDVIIDNQSVYCKNMIWQNIQEGSGLSGTREKKIFINGSLEFDPYMKQDFKGDFHMISSALDNTINVNGNKINQDIHFDNPDGKWLISNDLYINDTLNLIAGYIELKDINLDVFYINATSDLKKTISAGKSKIFLKSRTNAAPFFKVNTSNLVFDEGTSEVIFTNTIYSFLSIVGNKDISFYNIRYLCPFGEVGGFVSGGSILKAKTIYLQGSGSVYGRLTSDTLHLNSGGTIYLYDGQKEINTLIANGDCKGKITLQGVTGSAGKPILKFNKPQSISGLVVYNIKVTGNTPVFTANSIDKGQNEGWTFGEVTRRKLFWVGGTGIWTDRKHWSLSSGGVGGECIPTASDDVYIDENSFKESNGYITWDSLFVGSCRDFIVNNPFNPEVRMNLLSCYGNFDLKTKVQFNSALEFSGLQPIQTVYTGGNPLSRIEILTKGVIMLLDDLNLNNYFILTNGTFNANNYKVSLQNIQILGRDTLATLELGSSEMIIKGISQPGLQPFIAANNSVINGQNATLEFSSSNSGYEIFSKKATLKEISFPNINGMGYLNSFTNIEVKKIILGGSGIFKSNYFNINGSMRVDSLLLSAGKSYSFQNSDTLFVYKYLKAKGNNCLPISISSDFTGTKSVFLMPYTSKIDADFMQIRDITGAGDATFNAGAYSTNVEDSNINWVFPDPQPTKDVGFLGEDRYLCPDVPVVLLDAFNNTNTELYKWSDNSDGPTLAVQSPGTYYAQVVFGNNCIIYDTVQVKQGTVLKNILPRDTVLCAQQPFTINATLPSSGVDILWQNGSSKSEITVNTSGVYEILAFTGGCRSRDSIKVDYVLLNKPNLGEDLQKCQGETVKLSVNQSQGLLRWDNNSNSPDRIITNTGYFWAEVSKEICKVRDSIYIEFKPIPVFSLGPDIVECEGTPVILNPFIENATISWQDGDVKPTYAPTKTGIYTATLEKEKCRFTDSIFVRFKQMPQIKLGKDTVLCNDEQLILQIEYKNDVTWQNGSKADNFTIKNPGVYFVSATEEGCTGSDTLKVSYVKVIKPNIGKDTSFCDGNAITLRTLGSYNGYTWSNGSVNSQITVDKAGQYVLRVNEGRCFKTDTVNINLLPLPAVQATEEYFICNGTSKDLTLTGQFDLIRWDNGQTGTVRTVSTAGDYGYTAVFGSCDIRSKVKVGKVAFDIPRDSVFYLCVGEKKNIQIQDNDITVTWSNGFVGPFISLKDEGIYQGYMVKKGCQDTLTVEILHVPCKEDGFYAPSIFSPVSTTGNELFKVTASKYAAVKTFTMSIYDRWGQLLWTTDDIEAGWDGTFKGSIMQPGVYVYKYLSDFTISERDFTIHKAGTITLVR